MNESIEYPVKHLNLLELSCNMEEFQPERTALNPAASVFRLGWDAAVVARLQVQDLIDEDQQE